MNQSGISAKTALDFIKYDVMNHYWSCYKSDMDTGDWLKLAALLSNKINIVIVPYTCQT